MLARYVVEGDDVATIERLKQEVVEREGYIATRLEESLRGESRRIRSRLAAFEECAQRWRTAEAMTRALLRKVQEDPRRCDQKAVDARLGEIDEHAGLSPLTVAGQRHT